LKATEFPVAFLNRKYAEPKTPNQRSENKADFLLLVIIVLIGLICTNLSMFIPSVLERLRFILLHENTILPTRSQRMETVAFSHCFDFRFLYLF
jgi:hypothetical protein